MSISFKFLHPANISSALSIFPKVIPLKSMLLTIEYSNIDLTFRISEASKSLNFIVSACKLINASARSPCSFTWFPFIIIFFMNPLVSLRCDMLLSSSSVLFSIIFKNSGNSSALGPLIIYNLLPYSITLAISLMSMIPYMNDGILNSYVSKPVSGIFML